MRPASTSISARRRAQGVLAAGALRCIGGQMQGRLILLRHEEKRTRAAGMGVKDPNKKYDMTEMAAATRSAAATGVTDGALLRGVRFGKEVITTETISFMLRHRHRPPHPRRAQRKLSKFHLD